MQLLRLASGAALVLVFMFAQSSAQSNPKCQLTIDKVKQAQPNDKDKGKVGPHCYLEPSDGYSTLLVISGLGLTDTPRPSYPSQPADSREFRCRYSWSAIVFSTISPNVVLYTLDDLNGIPHQITFPTTQNCQVRFTFRGEVLRIKLIGKVASKIGSPDEPALSNFSPGSAEPTGFKGWYRHWIQDTSEAPGARDIQASWNPSFNAPQKLNVIATYQPLKSVRKIFWFGIFAFVDKEDRAQQDPDTITTTLDLVFRRDYRDLDSRLRPITLEFRTGDELAPKSKVLNQINALYLSQPFAFSTKAQPSVFTLSPLAGIEMGANFENNAINAHSAIFRLVAGADASLRHPVPLKWLFGSKPYTLNGTIRARFPRISEVFTENQKPSLPENIDRRLRIYSKAQISIPLSRQIAGSVTYQYGDVPPAFRFFGHTISIGIKVTNPGDYER